MNNSFLLYPARGKWNPIVQFYYKEYISKIYATYKRNIHFPYQWRV